MLTEKERNDLEKGQPSWKIFWAAFSILFIMVPTAVHYLYESRQQKKIRQYPVLAVGEISRLTYRGGKGKHFYQVCAVYQVNGVQLTCFGKALRTLGPARRDSLLGVHLPVIYQKTDSANGMLLYSEAQFNRFNLPFPDSLDWTRSYFLD